MIMQDDGLPFLKRCDYSKLYLKLGDSTFTFGYGKSHDEQSYRDPEFSLFLPGLSYGEVFCTVSMLFDGSLVLYKEVNSYPEIFINGHRVPSEMQISLKPTDVVVFGSLDHIYTVSILDDAELDEEEIIAPKEMLYRTAENLVLSGDLSIPVHQWSTDGSIDLSSSASASASSSASATSTAAVSNSDAFQSFAVFICSAQEIAEWLTWFGVLAEASVVVAVEEGAARLDVKMMVGSDEGAERKSKPGARYHMRSLTLECSVEMGDESSNDIYADKNTGTGTGTGTSTGTSSSATNNSSTRANAKTSSNSTITEVNTRALDEIRNLALRIHHVQKLIEQFTTMDHGDFHSTNVNTNITAFCAPLAIIPEYSTLGGEEGEDGEGDGEGEKEGETAIDGPASHVRKLPSNNCSSEQAGSGSKNNNNNNKARKKSRRSVSLPAIITKALIDLRRSSPILRQSRRRWIQLCASALIHLCLPPDVPSAPSPISASLSPSSLSSSSSSSGFQAAEEKLERTLALYWNSTLTRDSSTAMQKIMCSTVECLLVLGVQRYLRVSEQEDGRGGGGSGGGTGNALKSTSSSTSTSATGGGLFSFFASLFASSSDFIDHNSSSNSIISNIEELRALLKQCIDVRSSGSKPKARSTAFTTLKANHESASFSSGASTPTTSSFSNLTSSASSLPPLQTGEFSFGSPSSARPTTNTAMNGTGAGSLDYNYDDDRVSPYPESAMMSPCFGGSRSSDADDDDSKNTDDRRNHGITLANRSLDEIALLDEMKTKLSSEDVATTED